MNLIVKVTKWPYFKLLLKRFCFNCESANMRYVGPMPIYLLVLNEDRYRNGIITQRVQVAAQQGHREYLSRNWKIPPTQYQNSRKFPFRKYFKTSHKDRTFRSVNLSIFAGFSQTAFCRTSNGNFFL